ncbi:MAG: hypothetical protein AABX88_02405 [Nanoarchaeota archaeon]
MNNYKRGNASSKPIYEIDPETGKITYYNLPADAVMPEAKPGSKLGIPFLDDVNEELAKNDLIKKLKMCEKIAK